MTTHATGTREEWRTARLRLLQAEKELTRRSDELALRRQELPWVQVDKEYRFETEGGTASLTDLFDGRSQLLVYHFMFGPDYQAGCPSCSSIADGFDGIVVHLANHDVTLMAVSRAPLAKLRAFFENPEGRLEANYQDTIFVSNEENFAAALRQHPYREVFIDHFEGSWGHATALGNQLVARAAARGVLEALGTSVSPNGAVRNQAQGPAK